LSMIVILLLTASGVRLMLSYPHIGARDWIIFTVFLAAASLTRHISCVLAAALPIAMIVIMIERGLPLRPGHQDAIAAAKVQFPKMAKVWLISVATGLIGLIFATSVTHLLCWR